MQATVTVTTSGVAVPEDLTTNEIAELAFQTSASKGTLEGYFDRACELYDAQQAGPKAKP